MQSPIFIETREAQVISRVWAEVETAGQPVLCKRERVKSLDRQGPGLLGQLISTWIAKHGHGKALESAAVWNVKPCFLPAVRCGQTT